MSGAACEVLIAFFGDATPVRFDFPALPGVYRTFPKLSAALDERVFAGIHFRSACRDGNTIGSGVADYIVSNALQPVNGNHQGQLSR